MLVGLHIDASIREIQLIKRVHFIAHSLSCYQSHGTYVLRTTEAMQLSSNLANLLKQLPEVNKIAFKLNHDSLF